ncbi:MAG: hypothetical protein V5A43_05410 [Haloarculaceae archaeon]
MHPERARARREPTEGGREPTEGGQEPTEGGREPTEGGREPTEGGREPTEGRREAGGLGRDLSDVRRLISRTYRRDGTALLAPERATDYGAREFAIDVRKAANLLTHYGAGEGRRVAVAVGPKEPAAEDQPGWLGTAADPLYGILGGMVLGAPVDPAPDPDGTVEAPVVIAPTAWLDRFEGGPGTTVLAYGGPPRDPAVVHFERERWSENPVEPPEPLEPGRTALRMDGSEWAHQDLVSVAAEVAATEDLAAATHVRVAAPVDSREALVTGVLAPLVAGTPIRPVPGAESLDGDRGVFAVAGDEGRRLTIDDRP